MYLNIQISAKIYDNDSFKSFVRRVSITTITVSPLVTTKSYAVPADFKVLVYDFSVSSDFSLHVFFLLQLVYIVSADE